MSAWWWWLVTPAELLAIWLYVVIRDYRDRVRLRHILREMYPPIVNTKLPTYLSGTQVMSTQMASDFEPPSMSLSSAAADPPAPPVSSGHGACPGG